MITIYNASTNYNEMMGFYFLIFVMLLQQIGGLGSAVLFEVMGPVVLHEVICTQVSFVMIFWNS